MRKEIRTIYTLVLLILMGWTGVQNAVAASDRPFTVVIDAGHGGHDAGAVDNGVKEKDINLNVALQAGRLIEKNLKNVNVVYTRSDDTFRTLQERAAIANNAKGNLFISIHTNSVDKNNKNRTSVAGAQVYALGLHKDANNMSVARRENSVIELEKGYQERYSGFDPNKDESYIIFEMAQKGNLARSIKFAGEVENQLVKVAGRKDRGVHQAGFWVLWATSMPSVLVELDFICNPESAAYMDSENGVNQMADAIYKAVKNYEAGYSATNVKPSPKQVALEKERKKKESQSNKKQKVTTKKGTKDGVAENVASEADGIMLTTSSNMAEERKHIYKMPQSDATSGRKRRSKAARKISEAQTYETIKI